MDKTSIDGSWSSGEPLTVNIADGDFNKNTRLDDDFDVSAGSIEAIPVVQIGEPFTLQHSVSVVQGPDNDLVSNEALNNKNAEIQAKKAERTGALGDHTELRDRYDDLDLAKANLVLEEQKLKDATTVDGIQSARTLIADIKTSIATHEQWIADYKSITDNIEPLRAIDVLDQEIKALQAELKDLREDNSITSQYAKILYLNGTTITSNDSIVIDTSFDTSYIDLSKKTGVFQFVNYDLRSFDGNVASIVISNIDDKEVNTTIHTIDGDIDQGLELIELPTNYNSDGQLQITITPKDQDREDTRITGTLPIILDIFTFGQDDARYNDAIYRFEAEETETDSGIYSGTIEYIMLNQINTFDADTYSSLETIGDELDIIVHEDLTDEDAVEISYYERDGQGIQTLIGAQENAPTNSGIVSFDQDNYKVADTVTVTLEDADLNTDSDVKDIYTVVSTTTKPGTVSALKTMLRLIEMLLVRVIKPPILNHYFLM
jgi:hypothetical protein